MDLTSFSTSQKAVLGIVRLTWPKSHGGAKKRLDPTQNVITEMALIHNSLCDMPLCALPVTDSFKGFVLKDLGVQL